MRERTEVAGAIILLQAGEREAWDGIVEIYLQEQETLVVAEADVVAGLKLFDEATFKQKRLGFVLDDVSVKIVNGVNERIELQVPTLPSRRMKILRDTPAQVA